MKLLTIIGADGGGGTLLPTGLLLLPLLLRGPAPGTLGETSIPGGLIVSGARPELREEPNLCKILREQPILQNLGECTRWPGRVAGEPANLTLFAETYRPLGEPIVYGGLADALYPPPTQGDLLQVLICANLLL